MSKLFQRNEPNVTENRNKYVGGSDVPVILGLSKFKTQYELAAEKIGLVKNDFKGNEYTAFGHAIEPQIREYINLTTDYNFIENTVVNEKMGLRSNTDGVDKEAKTLLEIKSHGAVPTMEVYKAQMQLYMFQNNLEQGLLALYERPPDFNIEFDKDLLDTTVMVKYDEDFIDHLLYEIHLFWKRCKWLEDNPGASSWDYNNCIEDEIIKGGKRHMNKELQVKTLKFEPAVIEFNFDEIEKQLVGNLKKYEGLTFTEKEAKELNKTIADLRKGKRLVDQYRINTKKQLIEPVKKFEEDCNTLNSRFDEVIEPLLKQSNDFDEKQRNEKLLKVQAIKKTVIEDLQLVDEIAEQLVIEDRHTNKSTTLKSIEEDLHEQANQLLINKNNEKQGLELIKAQVEIANLKHGVTLYESSYIRLAKNGVSLEEIKEVIEKDIKLMEEDLLKEEETKVTEALEEEKKKRLETAKRMQESYENEKKANQEPEEEFIEIYQVTGTEEALDRLEEYMSSQNLTWTVKEDDNV